TQETKDHTSLGSQPQNLPHASSAQMAPAMTPKVQIGKAKRIMRWEIRSSSSGLGRLPATPATFSPDARLLSVRWEIRYVMPAAPETMNAPPARIVALTWMGIQ